MTFGMIPLSFPRQCLFSEQETNITTLAMQRSDIGQELGGPIGDSSLKIQINFAAVLILKGLERLPRYIPQEVKMLLHPSHVVYIFFGHSTSCPIHIRPIHKPSRFRW